MTIQVAAPVGSARVVIAGSGALRGRPPEFRRFGLAVVEHSSGFDALRDLADDTAALLATSDLPDLAVSALIDLARSLTRVPVILGTQAAAPTVARASDDGVAVVRLPVTPLRLLDAMRSARRPAAPPPERSALERGSFRLDLDGFRTTWHDVELRLPPRLFDVLRQLVVAAPRIVPFSAICDPHAGDADPHERARTAVARLRSTLADARPHAADPITTVHRVGYRLTP